MMDEFTSILDSAEIDPRPRWKSVVATIIEREMQHVPVVLAEELMRPRLASLGLRLKECIENGRIQDGGAWIAQLEAELRGAVAAERQRGRLKPVTSESEIERVLPSLQDGGYRAIEVESLLAVLARNERILEVAIRTIRTSTRTIARADLINILKPSTQTNSQSWSDQFPSEVELGEREADQAARANPRSPWSDNRNHDVPRGQ